MKTAKNPRILIVDDITEYAMVIEIYFPDGAESLTATNVDDAKRAFTEDCPITLAIVDIRLNEADTSDTSGLELLSWIRDEHPETPVVMISAYKSIEYEAESLERGAFCFLRKPLQPKQIEDVLGRLL